MEKGSTIRIENMKIVKTGKKHIIIIPAAFIKHKIIDPDVRYDVEFDKHQSD